MHPGTKLMEEVKLYWQIQLAAPALLSFAYRETTNEKILCDEFLSIGYGFILSTMLAVGMAYAMIGQYYIHIARTAATAIDTNTHPNQPTDTIITPTICSSYFLSGSFLWQRIFSINNLPAQLKYLPFVVSLLALYTFGALVYKEILNRDTGNNGHFRTYAKKMNFLYAPFLILFPLKIRLERPELSID